MASSSAVKMPSLRRDTAISELTRGCELTRRLQALLQETPPDDPCREPAGVLSLEVLRSLTAALCILDHHDQYSSGCEHPTICSQPSDHSGLTDTQRRMTRDPGAVEKPHGHTDKWDQHSRTELTATPYLDGHQWRKYGQKRIAGAKFSRSYYRCTYSDVDGCKATKQVQQAQGPPEDEPHMFVVKYRNQHTCRNKMTTEPTAESPCPLELAGISSESFQKQAWVSFGASNYPTRCETGPLLSFSSASSSSSDLQDESGAPNSLPSSDCSSWDCAASLEAVLQVSETGPVGGGFSSNSNCSILPEVVDGGLEDELFFGYDYSSFFDLEDENCLSNIVQSVLAN